MVAVEAEIMIEYKYLPLGRSQKNDIMFFKKLIVKSGSVVSYY